MPAEQLDAKRRSWLLRHDQDTKHIASSLPLVVGLPVRLTDTIDRKRFLFRGRRGHIYDWSPHPEEITQEVDDIWLLDRLPTVIYVKFAEATWTVGTLPPGVYPMTPASRTWQVNKHTKVNVRRTGYFLVPDFASTAHMIQGQSLDAAFADVVNDDLFEKASEELHVTAYVMLSRAKFLHQLWVMQPFGQPLFARGPPLGPDLLLRKLRGDITTEDAVNAFEDARLAASKEQGVKQKDPMDILFKCAACFLSDRPDYMKPPTAFGAHCRSEIVSLIISQGAWTRCLACAEYADKRRRERGAVPAMTDTSDASRAQLPAEDILLCLQCKLQRPRDYFSASTLKNETRSVRTKSGMTCNVCKGVAMCTDCRAWKAPNDFRSEQVVCKRCQKIKCSSCDTHIAPLKFDVNDRRDDFSHNRNVRCKLCKTKGLVGKHNNTYKTCSSCGLSLAVLAFRGSRGGARQD